MENQELLSDSTDSAATPIDFHTFDTHESPKLLKGRRWHDLPWLMITLTLYYVLLSMHPPTESPDMSQFNSKFLHSLTI